MTILLVKVGICRLDGEILMCWHYFFGEEFAILNSPPFFNEIWDFKKKKS